MASLGGTYTFESARQRVGVGRPRRDRRRNRSARQARKRNR